MFAIEREKVPAVLLLASVFFRRIIMYRVKYHGRRVASLQRSPVMRAVVFILVLTLTSVEIDLGSNSQSVPYCLKRRIFSSSATLFFFPFGSVFGRARLT